MGLLGFANVVVRPAVSHEVTSAFLRLMTFRWHDPITRFGLACDTPPERGSGEIGMGRSKLAREQRWRDVCKKSHVSKYVR